MKKGEVMTSKPPTSSLEKYIQILKRLGFKKVLEIPFEVLGDRHEKFFVFYHKRDAILLHFDTVLGSRPRDGNFYFNWKRRISEGGVYKRRILPEGYWSMHGKRDVFVGSDYVPGHDIRSVMTRLKQNGVFVSPWIEKPRISLELTTERIQLLPTEVRKALLL